MFQPQLVHEIKGRVHQY